MKKIKKIHFFKFDMYRLGLDSKGNSVQEFLDIKSKLVILDEIVKNKLNSNSSIKILKDLDKPNGQSAILEVITNNDSYVFGKLGREHDIKQFQIRKSDTLEPRNISKATDELFESFSYFLINKSTFAVSYIKESTAPSISYLSALITNEFKSTDKIWGWIECLVDENAIKALSGKDIIGTMYYDLTIPPEYTKKLLGLTEREYDLLQNQKGIKVGVTLKAEKRKTSVFENHENAETFFKSVRKKGLNFKIKARDDNDEMMQDFKLVDNPFTKNVNFEYNVGSLTDVKSIQSSIEDQLWYKSQQNEQAILRYIGIENDVLE